MDNDKEWCDGYSAYPIDGGDLPDCPYPEGSKEAEAWGNGLSDALEDFIASKYLD